MMLQITMSLVIVYLYTWTSHEVNGHVLCPFTKPNDIY
jgi:hypothetical protein